MAEGMGEGLRRALWAKLEAGDTTEGGAPSNLMMLAKQTRDAGGLQTEPAFRDFLAAVAPHLADRTPGWQGRLTDAARRFAPPPEAPPPAQMPEPASTQMPAAPYTGISRTSPGFHDLTAPHAHTLQLRRWLDELAADRNAAAAASPKATVLKQTEAAILRPVAGDQAALTEAGKTRLEQVRTQIDTASHPAGDTPAMAKVRTALATTPAQSTEVLGDFAGRYADAARALYARKGGIAENALFHPEIGPIDLLWGKEGTRSSDGFGLAKLLAWHPEVVADLPQRLETMQVESRSSNRIRLRGQDGRAVVRLEWDGQNRHWLLTAFDENVPRRTERSTDSLGDVLAGRLTPQPNRGVGDITPVAADNKPAMAPAPGEHPGLVVTSLQTGKTTHIQPPGTVKPGTAITPEALHARIIAQLQTDTRLQAVLSNAEESPDAARETVRKAYRAALGKMMADADNANLHAIAAAADVVRDRPIGMDDVREITSARQATAAPTAAASKYLPPATGEALQRQLARIQYRNTSYEAEIVRPDGKTALLSYVQGKSDSNLRKAMASRAESIRAFLGPDHDSRFTIGQDANGTTIKMAGGAQVRWSGRTQRDAYMAGELPYVGDHVAEAAPATPNSTPNPPEKSVETPAPDRETMPSAPADPAQAVEWWTGLKPAERKTALEAAGLKAPATTAWAYLSVAARARILAANRALPGGGNTETALPPPSEAGAPPPPPPEAPRAESTAAPEPERDARFTQEPPESTVPPEPERPAGYGADNTTFTADMAAKARARLREKLGRLNAGFDPEMALDGLTLAGFHIEAGARKFAAYAKEMIADLGGAARPHLAQWYTAVRMQHGFDARGMDDAQTVDAEGARLVEAGRGDQGAVSEDAGGAGSEGVHANAPGGNTGRPLAEREPPGAPDAGSDISQRPEGSLGEPTTAVGAGGGGTGAGGDAGVRPEDTGSPGAAGGHPPGDVGRPDAAVQGKNFVIEPGAIAEERGRAQKARDNLAAIRLVRLLTDESRFATMAEQGVLAKYVGWGGLSGAFPDSVGAYGKDFAKIGPELRTLLSGQEHAAASSSTQYAHYTAEHVIRSMWHAVEGMGF